MLGPAMSPTLLELIVVAVLLYLAWQIGRLIAPWVFASLAAFWRDARPPADPERWPPEKNITPPPTSDANPHPTHERPRR